MTVLEKLDAYNLVANLVPGAALVYALHYAGFPTPKPEEIGAFLLVSFVAGVTTNRLGSVALDPVLRKAGFLEEKDYKSFVRVERADRKLETLVANSGLYRTFFTGGLVFLILYGASSFVAWGNIHSAKAVFVAFVIVGMIVFLFALKKEDGYIHTRLRELQNETE